MKAASAALDSTNFAIQMVGIDFGRWICGVFASHSNPSPLSYVSKPAFLLAGNFARLQGDLDSCLVENIAVANFAEGVGKHLVYSLEIGAPYLPPRKVVPQGTIVRVTCP